MPAGGECFERGLPQQGGEEAQAICRAAVLQHAAGELHREELGLLGDDQGGAAERLLGQGRLQLIWHRLPVGGRVGGLGHGGSVGGGR